MTVKVHSYVNTMQLYLVYKAEKYTLQYIVRFHTKFKLRNNIRHKTSSPLWNNTVCTSNRVYKIRKLSDDDSFIETNINWLSHAKINFFDSSLYFDNSLQPHRQF